MEQPSVTYCATQSVDYLSQTHKWTDTDVISSYKEICKQLDIVQEKLREEREQKEESALRAEEKRLIRMKNALWKRMGQTHDIVQEELREEHEQKSLVTDNSFIIVEWNEREITSLNIDKYDRDKYLTVIAKENYTDFGKVCEMDVVCFGPYDPESIMHYSLGCYPQGRCIQAKPGTERTNAMGQRVRLSAYDINALNALYLSSQVKEEFKNESDTSLSALPLGP
ncbi:uncharacterized protein OCT59_009528 [Rhizophagus irregularis]|uniref:uncharacterized protein n=1 Tax=Rhizophagus irregularis TaxID=588596 RepID=UPI0033303A70|nr:hypothetical protein OCT59_009528 [Rhizophagus irregularis]